jgi:hypothetical protein
MLEIVLFLWGIGKSHNEEFSQANAGRRMSQVASTGCCSAPVAQALAWHAPGCSDWDEYAVHSGVRARPRRRHHNHSRHPSIDAAAPLPWAEVAQP